MKPDYKNWMPKGMILSFVAAAVAAAAGVCAVCLFTNGTVKTILLIVFAFAAAAFLALSIWGILMYRAFSYDGKRQMSKQIIEGIAAYVRLPEGGRGLRNSCGSSTAKRI